MDKQNITDSESLSLYHNLDKVYLRLSLTSLCNLRCKYCMPADGISRKPSNLLASDDELVELVRLFNDVRPTYKVRFTGGEPLLRSSMPTIVARVREMLPEAKLCMTTNAILLPQYADELVAAGMDSVNISLDTVDQVGFKQLARRDRLKETLKGIRSALDAGFKQIKINAVLIRSGNRENICDLVALGANYGVEVRFIELMPLGQGKELYPHEYYDSDEALTAISEEFKYIEPLGDGATSERHLLRRNGQEVVVGFIRTMSKPFCYTCDRMRVDAYGRLYTCLRSVLPHHLLQPLRAGEHDQVKSTILSAMKRKVIPTGEWPSRLMVKIGG